MRGFHPFDEERLERGALRTLVTVAALTDQILGGPKESASDVKMCFHI